MAMELSKKHIGDHEGNKISNIGTTIIGLLKIDE